jgi:vacuolar-type H+-ATPase subunit H
MPANAFDRVSRAESQAEEILAAARREAGKQVDKAKRESEQIIAGRAQQARAEAAKAIAAANKSNEDKLKQLLAGLDGEKAALAARAKANETHCITLITDALTR